MTIYGHEHKLAFISHSSVTQENHAHCTICGDLGEVEYSFEKSITEQNSEFLDDSSKLRLKSTIPFNPTTDYE